MVSAGARLPSEERTPARHPTDGHGDGQEPGWPAQVSSAGRGGGGALAIRKPPDPPGPADQLRQPGERAACTPHMAATAAVSGAKRSLRAELKQRLRTISAEERLRQSRLLAQKVMAHSQYQKAQRVSIFLSMHDEIETDEIIKDIFRRGKTCFIPRYQFQSSHMDMVRLASPEEIASLPKTSWNIHQPDEDEAREEALSTAPRPRSPPTFPRLRPAAVAQRKPRCPRRSGGFSAGRQTRSSGPTLPASRTSGPGGPSSCSLIQVRPRPSGGSSAPN